MTTVWLIGLILSFLGIYLFKGSRTRAIRNWNGDIIKSEKPVLKVGTTILYLIGALIPIFAIIMALAMIMFWTLSVYSEEDWTYPNSSRVSKLIEFLNKPVK